MKTWFAIDGTLEPIEYEGPSFFRFPAELAERVLLRYSSVGEWVFDQFCGFGTTLITAQWLDRQAVGFEKEAERARFGARRIIAPTRVVNDTIFQLSSMTCLISRPSSRAFPLPPSVSGIQMALRII